VDVTEKN